MTGRVLGLILATETAPANIHLKYTEFSSKAASLLTRLGYDIPPYWRKLLWICCFIWV